MCNNQDCETCASGMTCGNCKTCTYCDNWGKANFKTIASPCDSSPFHEPGACGISGGGVLREKLLEICDASQYSVSFHQRVQPGCQWKPLKKANDYKEVNDEKYESRFYRHFNRTESHLFFSTYWSGLCKWYRTLDNHQCQFECHEQDARHAAHFLGSEDPIYSKGWGGKNKTVDIEIEDCNGDKQKKTYPYLRYKCEMTGFVELAFPVSIFSCVMGVLITGQMLPADDKDAKRKFDTCIQKIKKLLTDEQKKADLTDEQKLQVEKDRREIDEVENSPSFTEEDIGQRARDMAKDIYMLEKFYENRMDQRLRAFSFTLHDEAMKVFFEVFPANENIVSGSVSHVIERYNQFCDAVSQSLQPICEAFGAKTAMLIHPNSLEKGESGAADMVARMITAHKKEGMNGEENVDHMDDKARPVDKSLIDRLNEKRLEGKNAEEKTKPHPLKQVCWINGEVINDILPKGHELKFGKDTLLCFAQPLQNESAVFIVVMDLAGLAPEESYGDDFNNLINKNVLQPLLDRTSEALRSRYAELLILHHKARNDEFIENMRHELGQIHIGTLALQHQFSEELSRFERLIQNLPLSYYDIENLKKHSKATSVYMTDVESYLHNSMLRVNSSRYMEGVPDPEYKEFYPYKKFLHKWKAIISQLAKEKVESFLIDELGSSDGPVSDDAISYGFLMANARWGDPQRPKMWADPDMIEQASYNLLFNAIKYAMDGTFIRADCKLNDVNDRYCLSVSNYSTSVGGTIDDLIQRGKRGKNIRYNPGAGIGLYLTDQIAKKHQVGECRGELLLDSVIISPYNVALIDSFINMDAKYKSKRFLDKFDFSETFEEDLIEAKKALQKKEKPGETSQWDKMICTPLALGGLSPLRVLVEIKQPTVLYTFTLSIPQP